jgi:hypothetical protein
MPIIVLTTLGQVNTPMPNDEPSGIAFDILIHQG